MACVAIENNMLMVYDSSLITRSGPFTGVICFIICINNARLGHGSLSPRRALGLSDFDHVHSKGISGTARVWLAMYFFGCNAGVQSTALRKGHKDRCARSRMW